MMSTRFLPMSWTSPLTVARTILPLLTPSSFSMCGSRCAAAAVVDQVQGGVPLLVGDAVAGQDLGGMDDRARQTCLTQLVQECAVQYHPSRLLQAKTDVGKPNDGVTVGQFLADPPGPFDRF